MVVTLIDGEGSSDRSPEARDTAKPTAGAGVASGRSSPKRSSLERLHRLLSAFDYEHTTLSLSELSRRSGLPLSTTHRMVSELLELGMLERGEGDRLCIGIDVWKFGLLTPKTHGIQRVALPFMQDLYATTGYPIHLGIPQGDYVTVVESLRPREPGHERPRVGQCDPYHVAAVGLALLAFCEPAFQEQYLQTLESQGAHGKEAPEEIRRALARTRAEGYCVNDHRTYPHVGIGAPILGQFGLPIASLSVVVPPGTSETPYGHMIRSAARAVQRTAWEQGIGAPRVSGMRKHRLSPVQSA
ncbi:IclR family transcriptional regulator [Nesterenkonia flava]|uniref:IclR family transcriptional regulator n=1 Tax=Nesterenkonia flava TaxID=469799 RepID=A0ABU1FQQ5_9MICC|nr:IclR family transcriptional regulator [Nesterenkonia flava]MDR5710602.1 IclR family transcriptional regulator [Nesterenkonia flava]